MMRAQLGAISSTKLCFGIVQCLHGMAGSNNVKASCMFRGNSAEHVFGRVHVWVS